VVQAQAGRRLHYSRVRASSTIVCCSQHYTQLSTVSVRWHHASSSEHYSIVFHIF